MRGEIVGVLLAAGLVLAGCDDQGGGQGAGNSAPYAPRGAQSEMLMADAAGPALLGRTAAKVDAPRMEVTRAYGIEVTGGTVKAAMEADRDACLKLGCTVVGVRTSADARYPTAHLEALVPQEQANAFHAQVTQDQGRVIEAFVETAANREQQYQDIQARLERLEFMRKRLYALADQKSDNVGDLLQVERELMRVESEIEQLTRVGMGLEKITDNVRVSLDYVQRPPKAGDVDFGPFTGLAADTANALILGVRATALFVARWLPAILVAGIVVMVVRRWRKAAKSAANAKMDIGG